MMPWHAVAPQVLGRAGIVMGGAYWLAIGALMAVSGAMMFRSYVDVRMSDRQGLTEQSAQLAEAGLDYAVKTLGDSDANWLTWPTSNPLTQSYANGQFSVTVQPVSADGIRDVMVTGTVLRNGAAAGNWVVCAHARRWIPADFFDHVIVSAASITVNGNVIVTGGELNDDVTGKGIKYADTLTKRGNAGVITDPTPTKDPSISPLPLFNMDWLRDKAKAQGNYYDENRLEDVEDGNDSFPINFYYTVPVTNPITGEVITPGEANVVFIEGALDLKVKGTEVVGGFFVVADSTTTSQLDVTGNAAVNGVIYSLGEVKLSGTAELLGAVWADGDVTLNGTVDLIYNSVYTNVIEDMDIPPQIQVMGYHRCQ